MLKKYVLVKQDDLKDCGVAALATILKYYGGYIPIEKLRELTKTNKNGTTAYHIVESAKTLGFNSYGIKCRLEDIDEIPLPVIAHTIINKVYKHFIVIYEINHKKKYVIIADPMDKIKKVTFEEFNEIFQNIIIVLFPIKKLYYENKNNIFRKRLKEIVKSYKYNIIIILLLSLFYMILNIVGLSYLKNIIDSNKIYTFFILSLLIELLKFVVNIIRNNIIIKFDKKINFEITKEVFFQIIKLPYNFYRNRTTGEVVSRLNDLESVKELLIYFSINTFFDLILIITFGVMLYLINNILFFISLLVVLLYIIVSSIGKNKISRDLQAVKMTKDNVNSIMIEDIVGFESIKGLNMEEGFMKKFSNNYFNYLEKRGFLNKIYNIKDSLKEFIHYIGIIIITFFGINLISKNILTFGEFLIFNQLLNYFLGIIKNVFNNEMNIKNMILSFKRIEDLYYDDFTNYEDKSINEINIKKLTYSHNDFSNILENINLNILQNDKIIMMGKSGSGKSTLLKLIKKYYKSDKIYSKNEQLNKNKNIIYISQNEFLFTDTINNNIVLDRSVSKEEFEKVIFTCQIDEIIKDKKIGYNMLIEENGFNISGGERQRIILARALITNPDVILLDEALSQVDTNLERIILKNIFKNYRNKIIIFVSHRKDNLDLFNKLFIVNDKKIKIIEKEG